jgi:hypothetical protein
VYQALYGPKGLVIFDHPYNAEYGAGHLLNAGTTSGIQIDQSGLSCGSPSASPQPSRSAVIRLQVRQVCHQQRRSAPAGPHAGDPGQRRRTTVPHRPRRDRRGSYDQARACQAAAEEARKRRHTWLCPISTYSNGDVGPSAMNVLLSAMMALFQRRAGRRMLAHGLSDTREVVSWVSPTDVSSGIHKHK